MQFSTIFTAIAALALGANAGVIPRDGARLGQFRIFGAEGCSALNYGFYTVDASDANTCHSFQGLPEGPAVQAVLLEALNSPAADGCTFSVYTDDACAANAQSPAVGVCDDVPVTSNAFLSWKIECPSL
ncbi:hypothetical protein F4804DRAFT_236919 [Jackrogersella minutella]|nr:hypothetical protein F4804DRAFT_236919 [Jackrogersella minutella]